MNPEQTLIYERRVRDRTAAAAALAGVLLIVASIITLGGPHTSVNELTLDLLVANERFPRDLISSIITGIAALSAAWTLVYLYNAAHARNPMVKPYIRIVAILGGALSAVSGIAYAIIVAIKVHEFATTGIQTYQEADRLTSGGGLLVLQLLGQASALLVAVGFVLVSLQAMQQGLLTRFMGYLGMFAGALFLFQITQVPVVQCYWLLAVAYLISGRWPTGLPPAWVSGRSQPWPSSAELRAQRAVRGGATRGGAGGFFGGRSKPAPAGAPTGVPAAHATGVVEDGGAGRTRATTPKRKRKHRR